jgi:uncharacterized protein (TIGR02117 family)
MPALYRWAFLPLLLLTAFLAQADLPQSMAARAAEVLEAPRTIHVVSHGWHTGIVLRYKDIPSRLWPEKADFAGRTYLEVGWGDEAFYRSPKVTSGMALRAALMSEQSVLHVVGFDQAVTEYFPEGDIVVLRVSAGGIENLVRFIQASLAPHHGQRVQPLGPGLYGKSWFYPSKDRYSLFYNCNHWVADGLQQAGVSINVSSAMTSGNVICQASRDGERIR